MIVCRGCGHGNTDVVPFCESCGAFLEWEGERVEPRSGARRSAGAAQVGSVVQLPRQHDVVDSPTPTPRPESQPVDVPEPRLPEAELPRTPPVRPQAFDVGPADQYCGSCGAGNARERRYCRTCGEPLADVERDERLSWWSRVVAWFRRLFRRDKSLAAGERPEDWAKASATTTTKSRRRWRFRMPTRITLKGLRYPLLILAVAGFGIGPIRMQVTQWGFETYNSIRRVVAPVYVPVAGASASASSESGEHTAAAAIDQNKLSWWAEGVSGDGVGETLTVRFDGAVDVFKVGFINGAADAEFPLQPRAREVEVTFHDQVGQVAAKRLELAETDRELQTFDVSAESVSSVTVRILSTWAGQQGDATVAVGGGFPHQEVSTPFRSVIITR